ncbi:hypothetical protein GLI01_24330 [Gluconacetobacter liquefaciens]|uniref:Uncharacterized protein n=1 Tax=Gluconacetobacter liquefaciens TaxID=89584 RepID=A0A370G2V3_GLULI|nr:hypothetical protein [Gluconacetobacter liquefaciens]MBB2186400.1 hypothetical protein [Gluconacetobacter liquefaciens]RDI38065.1 hypothetical protein C7453_1042 [Gluconacetobacter liquefaciens]GBQ95874.1 hypothetical protein AA0522_0669 [Gluconacetobacter liquefaciens NRIC 0522]GEB38398.1 hypothetical protein GLI01_24330 [Gluconacetobacter liquefaciens]
MTFRLMGALVIAYSMDAVFLLPILVILLHLYGLAAVETADCDGTIIVLLAPRAMMHARLPSQMRPDLT